MVLTEQCNVTVNSEELIGNTTDVIGEVSYKPMSLQTGSTVLEKAFQSGF